MGDLVPIPTQEALQVHRQALEALVRHIIAMEDQALLNRALGDQVQPTRALGANGAQPRVGLGIVLRVLASVGGHTNFAQC